MRHSYLRVAHTVGRKVNVVVLKDELHYANSINWFCALPTESRIRRTETDGRKFADCTSMFYLMTNMTHNSFFFVYVYLNSVHVSSIQVLIIRRFNCINTISGICHSM